MERAQDQQQGRLVDARVMTRANAVGLVVAIERLPVKDPGHLGIGRAAIGVGPGQPDIGVALVLEEPAPPALGLLVEVREAPVELAEHRLGLLFLAALEQGQHQLLANRQHVRIALHQALQEGDGPAAVLIRLGAARGAGQGQELVVARQGDLQEVLPPAVVQSSWL